MGGYYTPYGSVNYRKNPTLLENMTTGCWYVNSAGSDVNFDITMHFSYGQIVTIARNGAIGIYRPSASGFNCWRHFYTYSWPTLYAGMTWEATVNSTYMGYIGITQLINGSLPFYPTFGEWYLDGNTEIYDAPKRYEPADASTHDIELTDNPTAPTFGTLRMKAKFEDYLRFRPGELSTDNIWVTLRTNGWFLNAKDDSVPLPPASPLVDSDKFPEWTGTRPGG
jgi:hypothetical protein